MNCAVLMAVHGLENRLAGAEVPEVLLQNVQMMGVRRLRRQPVLVALDAVIAVVVVRRDVGHIRL